MRKINICKVVGKEAKKSRGWFNANKYLIMRRVSQLSILTLFLLGPWLDMWIVKGNLSSSLLLETVPLTDPFVLLQSIFAGHSLATDVLIGVSIVIVFYLIVGGRVFCSWVCPVNMVTDAASWLRCKFGIKATSGGVSSKTRYWLLASVMISAFIAGSIVWELVNPVSILHRGIIFGMSFAWFLIAFVFLFDVFVVKNGWCSRICPMGAFYSLLGKFSLLRISAKNRDKCNDCLECFAVCPESQVINPVLKGEGSIVVLDGNCTNCGRCIDVCEPQVFSYSSRFKKN